MASAAAAGGAEGRSGQGWQMVGVLCRPRPRRLLLLVVVVLVVGQLSLNMLFYRNSDSIFYVNTTSSSGPLLFDSRLWWTSSRLPWLQSLPVGQANHTTALPPSVDHGKQDPSKSTQEGKDQVIPSSKAMKTSDTPSNMTVKDLVTLSSKTVKDQVSPSNKSVKATNTSTTTKVVKDPGIEKSEKSASVGVASGDGRDNTSRVSSPRPAVLPKNVMTKTEGAGAGRVLEMQDPAAGSPAASQSSGVKSALGSKQGSRSNGGLPEVMSGTEKPLCPPVPPHLVGVVKVNKTAPSMEEQERAHPELAPGGHFMPEDCMARHKVAIIIPYRDRISHLAVLLQHIHPILQRQQIDYTIFVVEQAGNGKFNRAMLMNVGALEALKHYPFNCFVFHDVDLLLEDDRNLYTCPEQPRHMSIAIDTMKYRLPYNAIFGGVSAMTVEQFRTVNGFSNKFWGWGGEDDDMSNRIKYHGFFISRYPANVGRYTMLTHKKDNPNPRRYQYLHEGMKRYKSDGLNSVKYRALDTQLRRLYTWVYVDLFPS